ncbi:hypothetical protein FOS14_12985 [Skermania sp. ID1734]|uniref:hypothetical protein n=1 Tax=Skermania sp. ID1734 TaxID=2597516 RepID=UPI00117D92CF|nr:hypothetical protein [Skermania sp. ID1734]TSD99266.1 hypothetical protein FOS14_12985 [Skermania sp. ID1734]
MATRGGHLPDPPWSAELLAQLHADNLDGDASAALWAHVHDDPEAASVIHALDRVSAQLGELADQPDACAPIPPDVLAVVESAIAAEGAPRAARFQPTRRWAYAGAAIAAAAAVVGVLAFTGIRSAPPNAPVQAQATPGHSADTLVDLGSRLRPDAVTALVGRHDLPGRLRDPDELAACLTANEVSGTVLGAAPVQFDGQQATALLVPGPRPPQITAIVVGPACAAGEPDTLARADIG